MAISASGTVEPEEIVDVGAQVAGIIKEFGTEPNSEKVIDYGSQVEPGTVLARIDESLYQEEVAVAVAALAQAEALTAQAHSQIEQAKANVRRAEADQLQLQVALRQTERDWGRAQQLREKNVITQQEYETAQTTWETAHRGSGRRPGGGRTSRSRRHHRGGERGGSESAGRRAQAALREAQTNLGYTTIRSPIRGVIVDRRVNIGQTVVASLNAPSLFLIAQDLRRCKFRASVNEADVGRLASARPCNSPSTPIPRRSSSARSSKCGSMPP